MRYLILLLFSFPVFAVDPAKTPEEILDCDAPLLRVDGSPISISEIAGYEWKISTDEGTVKTWATATNVTQSVTCEVVIDLTQLSDGGYYYSPLVRDTGGRISQVAYDVDPAEVVNIVVKRIADPRSPARVRQVSP